MRRRTNYLQLMSSFSVLPYVNIVEDCDGCLVRLPLKKEGEVWLGKVVMIKEE